VIAQCGDCPDFRGFSPKMGLSPSAGEVIAQCGDCPDFRGFSPKMGLSPSDGEVIAQCAGYMGRSASDGDFGPNRLSIIPWTSLVVL
jgi:hypothetical protein